jgi:hypothetical protein
MNVQDKFMIFHSIPLSKSSEVKCYGFFVVNGWGETGEFDNNAA